MGRTPKNKAKGKNATSAPPKVGLECSAKTRRTVPNVRKLTLGQLAVVVQNLLTPLRRYPPPLMMMEPPILNK